MGAAPATSSALAEQLVDLVASQVAALARGPLPELTLPRVLLGHEVGPDVRADLLFTLGLLHACGRSEVGGVDVERAIGRLLAGVDGRRTHTFYSYRVAETVARFGTFDDDANPVLRGLDAGSRAEVADATDSSTWVAALDEGRLPRNYAAVLARCGRARQSLGLDPPDDPRTASLVDRVRSLLGGHLDDANSRIGRYDIYTVDIHLFCEPFAHEIGQPWRDGARAALDLVDRVATRDGAAVAWGRSTGVLATCHTIELAGLVTRHPDLATDPGRWLARAAHAAATLPGWFQDGWVTAHQHRSSDPYRGLDRRLQLTLDCLGKLVDTALALRTGGDVAIPETELFGARDEMVWFDASRNAGVWSHRSRGSAFTLPLVGGTTTDYLPAPRNPGLFEVPVGRALATGTPVVFRKGVRYVAAGLPTSVRHEPGSVRATYDGFPEAGTLESGGEPLAGTREVTWRVDGRSLVVDERLAFAEEPHAVALQVTEAADRPLVVRLDADQPHTTAVLATDGIAEYRSCWGELPRLHQIDVAPSRRVHLRWSVTPMLRTVSTAAGHHYNDSLYAPMADRVSVERLPHSAATNPAALAALAARTDQFHLHWPEWLLLPDLAAHERLIAGLRDHGVRLVWTQHNLVPHTKDPTMAPVYAAWADAADLVLHHSHWGEAKATSTYRYGDHTRHVVIPHGHFGATDVEVDAEPRPSRIGPIRLGIVGAPRLEKDVALVMRAVARCRREDMHLVVHSLAGDEEVPDDPRIEAYRYEMVPRPAYDRMLAGLDALVMPFDPEGEMLTTGTTGDALGFGLPTIASSWGYLTEALGPAAVTYGRTEDELVACLDSLTWDDLEAAAAEARRRRPAHGWPVIAERTYEELDRLGSGHH